MLPLTVAAVAAIFSIDAIVPVGEADKGLWETNLKHLENNVKLDKIHSVHTGELEREILAWGGVGSSQTRSGWVTQQLIKLLAPLYFEKVHGRGEVYLITDADVRWYSSPPLPHDNQTIYFNTGGGMDRLVYAGFPSYMLGRAVADVSPTGIAHYMVFTTPTLRKLMADVERAHGRPFTEVFLQSPVRQSEYQLYYSYAMSQNTMLNYTYEVKKTAFEVSGDCEARVSPAAYVACHGHFRRCGARGHWGVEQYNTNVKEPLSISVAHDAVKIRVTNFIHVFEKLLGPGVPCGHQVAYAVSWLLAAAEPCLYTYLAFKLPPAPPYALATSTLFATLMYSTLYPLQPPFYTYAVFALIAFAMKEPRGWVHKVAAMGGVWYGLVVPMAAYGDPCLAWVGLAVMAVANPPKGSRGFILPCCLLK